MSDYSREEGNFQLGEIMKFLGLGGDYLTEQFNLDDRKKALDLQIEGDKLATEANLEDLATQSWQREQDAAGKNYNMTGAGMGVRALARESDVAQTRDRITAGADLQRRAAELQKKSIDRQKLTSTIGLFANVAGQGLSTYNDALENNWFGLANKTDTRRGYAWRAGS